VAKELKARISIPYLVRSRYSTASVIARLDEKEKVWVVKKLDGEPIFRALLFEAVGGSVVDRYLSFLLNHTDYTLVKINFVFQDAPPFNGSDHWKYSTLKNKISLRYHDFPDPDIDPVSNGIDLKRAFSSGAKFKKNGYDLGNGDRDLLRLLHSPAFLQPIR